MSHDKLATTTRKSTKRTKDFKPKEEIMVDQWINA